MTKQKKAKRAKAATRAKRNGKATKDNGRVPVTPEQIEKLEFDRLQSIQDDLRQMRTRQGELKREAGILTGDIYRKEDELKRVVGDLAEKYSLEKGVREVDVNTGHIVEP